MQSAVLSKILTIDAVTCVGMGLMLVVFAGTASRLLAIPENLLSVAGWLLLPVAALMAFAAIRGMQSGLVPMLIVLGNIAWVVASLLLLVLVEPNALGVAFVLTQAAVVAIFAWLEWRAVRTAQSSKNPASS